MKMAPKEPPTKQERGSETCAEMGARREISGTVTSITLLAIFVISICIRLFSVVRWGSVRSAS